MDDRRRSLLGDAGGEAAVNVVDEVQIAGLRLLPLPLPALQLPLDVGLLAAQLPQADGVGIDVVDLDQRVDDALADRLALPLVERVRVLGRAQDRALDEIHDVEGRAVHRFVLAEAGHRRDRNRGLLEGGDHAVLAAHVVGRAEPLAQRRAAERPAAAGGVADAEGQVRAAPGDAIELQRRLCPRHVRLEPGLDPGAVDPLGVSSLLRHVQAYDGPPPLASGGSI